MFSKCVGRLEMNICSRFDIWQAVKEVSRPVAWHAAPHAARSGTQALHHDDPPPLAVEGRSWSLWLAAVLCDCSAQPKRHIQAMQSLLQP
jgi:hypothetical protein